LYGPTPAIGAASALIEAELERLSEAEQTITIPANAARFFAQQGLDQLKAMHPDADVHYNAALRILIVRNERKLLHSVQRVLEQANTFIANDVSSSNPDATCQICLDTPTAPRTLLCGHVACTGCLRHRFSSIVDASAMPLVCMGDDANCKTPFPIALIRDFLDEGAFDNMLSLALIAHVDRKADEFRPCRTTDCNQIYSLQPDTATLSCPSCFSEVCAECGEDVHEDVSCEQVRLENDRREQERLTEEYIRGQIEIKRCPSCRTPIIKNNGCNHITCK
jgi:hypothetical protein